MNLAGSGIRIKTRWVAIAGFMLLSLLLAAYIPMSTVNAQAAAEASKLKDIKQRATKELDRRIANLEKTLNGLSVEVQADSGGASVTANKENGGNASITVAQDGLNAEVNLPTDIKTKAKEFLQKMIDQLKKLKEKVEGTTSLATIQSLGKNIDSQFNLDQLTQVQASVTQAVESLTGVFDNLKTTAQNLQGQVAKIKECVKSVRDGTGSVSGNASVSGKDANANVSGNGGGCEGLNVSSEDVAAQAQSQLDNIKTMMTTIGSVLMSSVTLLTSLITQFGSLTSGLGNLGSLGNLGNLSNLTSSGDLSKLTDSLGSITGMMSSFSAITSQLDLAGGMAGNLQGLLGTLTSFINI